MSAKPELILALDLPTEDEALAFLKKSGKDLKWVKIGLQLFLKYGRDITCRVSDLGYNVFLDLKLHDIPNTVASAILNLSECSIKMLTLHTAGGPEMMRWAREAQEASNPDLKLLGVTVLTSMKRTHLAQVGFDEEPVRLVLRLAMLSQEVPLHGLVCAATELADLREVLGPEPVLVTPGIRPLNFSADDQERIATPAEAIRLGANYLVMGRPILRAEQPAKVIDEVLAEIDAAAAPA
ncbi:MAG: orotidine-5'-phosphate decarboxylase [Opitutales bacterium]